MKQLAIILAWVCSAAFGAVFAQVPNTWTQVSSLSAGERERMVSFSINGFGYVACGQDTANQVKNDLWEYDPIADSWTQKASLPGAGRRNAIGFSVGSNGFVGCGIDGPDAPTSNILRDFWKYSPGTNSWVQVADFPGGGGFGIYFAASFSLDTKGYVIGGKFNTNTYSSEFWEYKPSADQWFQRAQFPGGVRYQLSAFGASGKVYAGLGTDNDMMRKDWWEFDPATNLWAQKNDFQGSVRAACASFTSNGHGFICLGTDGGFIDDLWEYFPENDTWHVRADFPPSGRSWPSAFEINGEGYVGSGQAATGLKRSWYKYTPLPLVGVSDAEQDDALAVYPNPAVWGSKVRLNPQVSPQTLVVHDLAGKLLKTFNVKGIEEFEILDLLPTGRYLLLLRDDQDMIVGKEILTVL